jgi:small nuclear ribonucleoprotein
MLPSKQVQAWINKRVQIEMKKGKFVLEGVLKSVDYYMNIYMDDTVELQDGEKTRKLGAVLLRGNNIVSICEVKE